MTGTDSSTLVDAESPSFAALSGDKVCLFLHLSFLCSSAFFFYIFRFFFLFLFLHFCRSYEQAEI